MKNNPYINDQTLCWDCANATGNCRWSEKLKPVKGWTAEKTLKHSSYGSGQVLIESFIVRECPEFVRDCYGHGTKRIKECKASDGN